jgi:exopolyphosphatase/guanosine-5'-triphosphate,3'-diphosphate pyrophosphatase
MDRTLHRGDLRKAVDTLAALPSAERARLPGISAPRAAQSLAGAVIGHTAMKLTGLSTLTVCPWAIREGVMLRHLEDGPAWWAGVTGPAGDADAPPEPIPLRLAKH